MQRYNASAFMNALLLVAEYNKCIVRSHLAILYRKDVSKYLIQYLEAFHFIPIARKIYSGT